MLSIVNGRLIGATLLSDAGSAFITVAVLAIIAGLSAPAASTATVGGLVPALIGAATVAWRRINADCTRPRT